MDCYYKNPEATAEVLKGPWLFTGDMAREDEDGFIYLVDRKKDVVISGGENIYPVQIEDFLRSNPKIKDVAVIGLPDARLGEITAAIIELVEGQTCDAEEIDEFCKALKEGNIAVGGEKLKTMPRGFSADDPAAEYIKHKSWVMILDIPDEDVGSFDEFTEYLINYVKRMEPMRKFLLKAAKYVDNQRPEFEW
jgi:acyl-CoA synthetase (AMP-forming)/AMP-acid ligase II